MSQSRPDLVGEVRFRFPLPIVIPLAAVAIIGGAAFGFSKVLLAIPKDAAVAIALMMAVNVMGACAFLALKKNITPVLIAELIVVALYPVIIGVAIAEFGLGTAEETHGAAAAAEAEGGGEQPAAADGSLSISAAQVAFDTDTLELTAGEDTKLHFSNEDSVQHNVSIYPDESGGDPLFEGQIIEGGAEVDYEIPALDAGEYYFQCDVHPGMNGTVTAA
jgi:plastocyanin